LEKEETSRQGGFTIPFLSGVFADLQGFKNLEGLPEGNHSSLRESDCRPDGYFKIPVNPDL